MTKLHPALLCNRCSAWVPGTNASKEQRTRFVTIAIGLDKARLVVPVQQSAERFTELTDLRYVL